MKLSVITSDLLLEKININDYLNFALNDAINKIVIDKLQIKVGKNDR